MQRLPILLINRDPQFLDDEQHLIERRGCDLHSATSADEVRALLARHHFVLGVINGLSARFTPKSLKVLHLLLRRDEIPVSTIFLSPPEAAAEMRALKLEGLHVLTPPLMHNYLLELSSRLIGVGQRRAARAVLQIYPEDHEIGVRVGFLEEISRHGFIVRLDDVDLSKIKEGGVRFMLTGVPEEISARFRFARVIDSPKSNRFACEFTDVTEENWERIAGYVGED